MILSVDPGFSNYGYAVWNEYGEIVKVGVLTTEKTKVKINRISDDTAFRIASLTTQLNDVIRTHSINGVIGEMPSGGGKSSAAVKNMALALAITVAVITLNRIPIEWCSALEVKIAMTGKKQATKLDMMLATCMVFPSWKLTTKTKTFKNKKDRVDNIYWPLGKEMGANKFEHVADAIGVAYALKNSNIIKMYCNKRK
jgi:Holliday junction resolvasome RuvABC endonuclease subunit